MEQQQQALKYERRIQELEVGLAHGLTALPRSAAVTAVGCAATVPTILDYIPRSEHLRVVSSRLLLSRVAVTFIMHGMTSLVWNLQLPQVLGIVVAAAAAVPSRYLRHRHIAPLLIHTRSWSRAWLPKSQTCRWSSTAG